ncbi:hypothetical protein ACFP47_10060 [Nesterenkonia lacusekhoensis]|uniref:DUF4258 domain-containing protein n=1 Tax=Nesterenkonia lacusekhoensis TaxID=150832 RepID=A0ABS4T515_9MICC|nr:hypothetical protein [Nesterenkonia lacusekhoensis]MBP2319545.1 hypothetical protein [Nesterenkonia lacusekhoensis]
MSQRNISWSEVSQVLYEHKRGVSFPSPDHPMRRVYTLSLERGSLCVVTQPAIEDTAPDGNVQVITVYYRDE